MFLRLSARASARVLGGIAAGGGCAALLAANAGPRLRAEEVERSKLVKDQKDEKPKRLPIGGIAHEYRKPMRTVRRVDPPLSGFFAKETIVHGVALRSHDCVSDSALCVAADRLGRMLRNLPGAVLDRLSRRGGAWRHFVSSIFPVGRGMEHFSGWGCWWYIGDRLCPVYCQMAP